MGLRADNAIVEAGLAASRSKAKEMITSGIVAYNGRQVSKASENIGDLSLLSVTGEVLPYVSRGGLKLEKALAYFNVDVKGLTCVDVGASTGGFTDCLLQNGADYVYAVDCGHDQLSKKLLDDSHVFNMEGTNARYICKDDFDREVDIVTCDASFISLTLLLPAMADICKENGKLILLIKPQFEAGKENLNKKGVVKDEKVHKQVIQKIVDFSKNLGLSVIGITESPIKGPEGNTEYLIYMSKGEST